MRLFGLKKHTMDTICMAKDNHGSCKHLSDRYTWNVFSAVQNEENHIRDVIGAIQAQDQPPTRILVANHGSTDKTGEILDSIKGIEVTHHKASTQTYLPDEYFKIRNNLFKEASAGADYVMCVDGDTVVPDSYVDSTVKRMRRDGVVIACGQDPNNKVTLAVESPSVVDAKWLAEFHDPARTSSMNTSVLVVHASLTGFRAAVYTDIPVKYKRKILANSNRQIIEAHGRQLKHDGFSLWYVVLMAIKRRDWRYVSGYRATKETSKDAQITAWWNRYQREKVFGKIGMKHTLLKNTGTAMYVEPWRRGCRTRTESQKSS